MAKPLGQCVIKGKTIDLHLETEEGRGLLRWVISQPIVPEPDKEWYEPWAMRRNKYISEKLEMHPDDPQLSEQSVTPEKETALKALSNQVIDHESRLKKLEDSMGVEWNE